MIKILIVDDHKIVRDGLSRILSSVDGLYVVDDVGSGEEAIDMVIRHRPNIVLMDLSMPGIGGLEATKRILRHASDTKIIILTLLCAGPLPENILSNGVHAYLSKGVGAQEVIKAIEAVHLGERYLSKDIAQSLALRAFSKKDSIPFQSLSDREMQIASMIIHCYSVRQIATSLSVSPKTVNSYRYRIFSKLNISGDMQLAILAIQYQIVHPSEINLHRSRVF